MSNINHVVALLTNAKYFVFDTETAPGSTGNALDPHTLELVGIAFFVQGEASYLPFPEDDFGQQDFINSMKIIFNAGKVIIGHNLKFDLQVLKKYGIEVRAQLIDTMVAHYLVDPNSKRHGLKYISKKMFNYEQTTIEKLVGTGTNQRSMKDVPIEQITEYACDDVRQTFKIWQVLRKQLQELGLMELFLNIECRLIPCLAEMEYHGVRVNGKQLRSYFKRADDDLDVLAEKIFALAGAEFNVASSAQVSKLLFDELDLLPIGERGKSGHYSVGKSALKKLQNKHPVVPLIANFKADKSMASNFLVKLPKTIHIKTGNVHAKFNQTVATTGRLSSSEPNLQNIPKQATGMGYEIRGAFVSVKPGNKIITADFSQIEVRLLAHCSGDVNLIDAFKNGKDIHSIVAAGIFEVPVNEITNEDPRRKTAKTVVFGINYGMTPKGLASRLTEVLQREVTKYEAEDYIDKYFEKFPDIKRYQTECYYSASDTGYAQTILGRKRMIPDINSLDKAKQAAAKRIAMNMPIQGSAADIIKIAMIKIHEEIRRRDLKSKIALQVHDELVLDTEASELSIILPLVKRHMENTIPLKVPMEVVIKVGENWRDGEKWDGQNVTW